MKKYYSIALCAALLPSVVMAGIWSGSNGDYSVGSNWDTGTVPGIADAADIYGAVAVTVSTTEQANRFLTGSGGSITIVAGGELTSATQALIAQSGTGSLLIDGGTLTVGTEFPVGVDGQGTLTINSGTINANGPWLIAGYNSASTGDIVINGGALNAAGHLYIGLNGSGSLTINDGNVTLDGQLVVASAAGGTGNIIINGGVTTAAGLNFGQAGTQTLDLNDGQLITTGGFTEGVNSTFLIGSGELIFAGGSTYAEVETLVSQSNWIFDGAKSIVDNGDGTITVTSVIEPSTMGLLGLIGEAVLVFVDFFV